MTKQKVAHNPDQNSSHSKSTLILLNLIIVFLLVINVILGYSLINKAAQIAKNEHSEIDLNAVPDNIQIEVLNGCGVSGLAEDFTAYLREEKIDVVNFGNYFSFDVDNSILIDRTGNKNNLKKVASVLGLSDNNLIEHLNKDYLLDFTFIIGKDFFKLKPFKKGN